MTEPDGHRRRALPPPFGVLAASLATFLAVLALLAAQMLNGRDPALGRAQIAQVAGHAGKSVVTRTSGGAVVQVRGATAHGSHPSPITTRASGGGEGDD